MNGRNGRDVARAGDPDCGDDTAGARSNASGPGGRAGTVHGARPNATRVRLTDGLPYFDAVSRACTGLMLRYFFECGVPMYGNSFRMSVWGFRPVGGH